MLVFVDDDSERAFSSRTRPRLQSVPVRAGHRTSEKIVFSEAETATTSENTHD
ncbi:hypothetical protein Aros01_03993 [Streptosporangium roseum]